MLSKEKQKALIEAMLFVSTAPVPIAKILRKLKHANRIDEKLKGNPDQAQEVLEDVDASCEIHATEEGVQTANDGQTEDQIDVEENEDDVFEIHHDDIAETIDHLADASAQNDNVAEGGNLTDVISVSGQSEDSAEDADIMQQLMLKQQELDQDLSVADVKALLDEIEASLKTEDRGLELVVVAKGYQIRTKYDVSIYLREEKVKVPQRFSPSSLETLAIVAYQQPITRQRVEEIRGVDSGGVMKTLLDKGILRVVGRSDEPGKPLIYGTSRKFLEVFGLKQLRDLPSLQDFHALQMSQDRDVLGESDADANVEDNDENHIRVDDLLETTYQDMDEADQVVLDSLDESLSDLKRVERDVLAAAEPKDQNVDPVATTMVTDTSDQEQNPSS